MTSSSLSCSMSTKNVDTDFQSRSLAAPYQDFAHHQSAILYFTHTKKEGTSVNLHNTSNTTDRHRLVREIQREY